MKIVIVDDERPARSELKYLLEQCRPEWKLIEASNWRICGYSTWRHEWYHIGIYVT